MYNLKYEKYERKTIKYYQILNYIYHQLIIYLFIFIYFHLFHHTRYTCIGFGSSFWSRRFEIGIDPNFPLL